MYPAQAYFDGLYTQDDLPDELTINPYDLGNASVVVQRNGLIYGPHQFFAGYQQQVTIKEMPYPESPEIGPSWVLEAIGESGVGILDDSQCLFAETPFGEFGAGAGGITDLFEDTYAVTVNFAGGGSLSSVIDRVSLCLWVTEDITTEIYFAGLEYNSNTCKWEHFDSDDIRGIKQDPHNTPVGTYISGGGASADPPSVVDATIIIS